MPSNDTSMLGSATGQYLLGLLADGAQPFLYRGGVHRLLGFPDQTVRPMRPGLPSIPVGFQYERRGFAAPFPPSARQPGSVRVMPDVLEEAAIEEHDTPAALRPEPGPARGSSSQLPSPPPMLPPRSARETPDVLEEAAIKEHDAPAVPHPEPRRASALSNASSGSPPPPRPSPSRPEAAATRNKPSLSEPASRPGVGQAEVSAGLDMETPSAQRPKAARQVGLEIPGVTRRRMLFAALSSGSDAAQAMTDAPQALPDTLFPLPKPAADAVAPSQGVETPPSAGQPSAEQRPSASSPNGVSSRPAQPSSFEAQALQLRSRNRGTEEVEHLRRAVTTLAARQSSAREERRQEPLRREASPPPAVSPHPAPQQQVVVVRQTAAPCRRTPRAFWASSTLRSTHLRILR